MAMSNIDELHDPAPDAPPPSQSTTVLSADREHRWMRGGIWAVLALGVLAALWIALA